MNQVVTQLSTGLTADTMWTGVSSVMPLIIGLTIFGFGFYLVRKVVKKARVGKAL